MRLCGLNALNWITQLPHYQDALARICALIKPGGHLILDEIDARAYSEHKETPEAVTFFHDRIEDWTSQRGESQNIGNELQPCISKLGIFLDVTVKILVVPFSPGWDGRKWFFWGRVGRLRVPLASVLLMCAVWILMLF